MTPGAFLVKITSATSTTPASVDWAIYSAGSVSSDYPGPSRSVFGIDNEDQLYFMFDFTTNQANVWRVEGVGMAQTVNVLLTMNNPTTQPDIVNNTVIGITYLTQQGQLAYVNGSPWGYHIISCDKFDLNNVPIKNVGKFGLEVDQSNNLVTYANVNTENPKAKLVLQQGYQWNFCGPTAPICKFLYKSSGGSVIWVVYWLFLEANLGYLSTNLSFFDAAGTNFQLLTQTSVGPPVYNFTDPPIPLYANFVQVGDSLYAIVGYSYTYLNQSFSSLCDLVIWKFDMTLLTYSVIYTLPNVSYSVQPAQTAIGSFVYFSICFEAGTLNMYRLDTTTDIVVALGSTAITAPTPWFYNNWSYNNGGKIMCVCRNTSKNNMMENDPTYPNGLVSSLPCKLVEFNVGTNTFTNKGSFIADGTGFMYIDTSRPDGRILAFISTWQTIALYIYELTDPTAPVLLATISQKASGIFTFYVQPLGGGQYNYWFFSSSQIYNLNDPANPVTIDTKMFSTTTYKPEVGNSAGFSALYVDPTTLYAYTQAASNGNYFQFSGFLGKTKIPFTDMQITSSHFALLPLGGFYSLPNAECFYSFVFQDQNFAMFAQAGLLIVHNITDITNTVPATYVFPYPFVGYVYQITGFQGQDAYYFAVTNGTSGEVVDIFTTPLEGPFNLTHVQQLVFGSSVTEVQFVFYKTYWWIFILTLDCTFYKYKQLSTPTFTYINSTQLLPNRDAVGFVCYDFPNGYFKLNVFAYPVPHEPDPKVPPYWLFVNIDDDFITFLFEFAASGFPAPYSYKSGFIEALGPDQVRIAVSGYDCWFTWKSAAYTFFENVTGRSALTTYTQRYFAWNNLLLQIYSEQGYYVIFNYNLYEPFDRLSCIFIYNPDLPGTHITYDETIFVNVNAGGFVQQMSYIFNNNKYTLVVLTDTGNVNLFDITNPYNLANVSSLFSPISSRTISAPYSFGAAFTHKINYVGNPDWFNVLGQSPGTSSRFVQNPQISNVAINSTDNSVYTIGCWEQAVDILEYTSTGSYVVTNHLYTEDTNNNYQGYGLLSSNTIGRITSILPFVGDNSVLMQKVQYNNFTNQFYVLFYASSIQVNLLQSQPRGSLIMPTNILTTFFGNSVYTSFVTNISNSNTFGWKIKLFTTEDQAGVQMYDLALLNNQLSVIGKTSSLIVQGVDSSGKAIQRLYSTKQRTTQAPYPTGLVYNFDSKGIYISSQYFTCGDFQVIDTNDIKIANGKIYLVPNYKPSLITDQTVTYFNKDGSFAISDTYNTIQYGGNIVVYNINSTYTDLNGSSYTRVVFTDPPTYDFTTNKFINYNLWIQGQPDDPVLNSNFSVRGNYISYTGSTPDYTLVLNRTIDTSLLDRQFFSVNGETGTYLVYHCNLSRSPLLSMANYNIADMPSANNQIVATLVPPVNFATGSNYFITFPIQTSSGPQSSIVPFTYVGLTGTQAILQFTDVNLLRVSQPTGPFYGPYININGENKSVSYKLNFFPASLYRKVTYSMQILSLTLPNRPLRNLSGTFPGGATYNDIPYIYVSIYNVDDLDNYDPELVNLVYDNNPLTVQPYPYYQVTVSNQSSANNFVTFNTTSIPNIIFLPTFFNLRVRIFDPNGNILLYDQSASKTSDARFPDGLIPTSLFDVYLRVSVTTTVIT